MKNKKKLLSIILVFALMFSTSTAAIFSASAATDENGCYVPSVDIENTNRYYFAMPSDWYNEYANSAGVYWWSGADACGAIDGTGGNVLWPGHKAQPGDLDGLFYVDCPKDVPVILWNNYLDGGEDMTAPIFTKAVQSVDLSASYYSEGDVEFFDNLDDGKFFSNMEESLKSDKKALGDFAENFFIDDEWGISFNFDNMIYIINPELTIENPVNGKITYGGEWYFYSGDGTYGSHPTKEASIKAGTLGDLSKMDLPSIPDQIETVPPTEPTLPEFDKYICFDVDSTGWQNVKTVYCHMWRLDGSDVEIWPAWQSKREKCEYDKSTGIATYDLSKTYNDFSLNDGNIYGVIFSANTGHMTYTAVMNGRCIGDTLYCTESLLEHPEDSEKMVIEAVWRSNPDCGPLKSITSSGEIVGTAYEEGATDATLIADYLIRYYDDPVKTARTQDLLDTLMVRPVDVYVVIVEKVGSPFTNYTAKVISDILEKCDDPTGDSGYIDDNCGDVNGDGKVNIADATEIQKAGIGLFKLTAEQAILADVNNDGRVSVLDTTMIQQFSVGLIEKF